MSTRSYSSSRSSSSRSVSGGYSQKVSAGQAVSMYGGSASGSQRISSGRALSVFAGASGGSQRISGSRSMSMYGGSGGGSVRASFSSGSRGGFDMSCGYSGASVNEKATMQNLNDRLATYLEKVRILETSNAHLEHQIREWYARTAPVTMNYTHHEKTIAEMRAKIQIAGLQNARIILQIDNAKLAADDFRVKNDNELVMRQSVEADVIGLKKVLDSLTITRSDLEIQVEGLKEELIFLKKNHNEEMVALRAHISVSSVNVEVDAAPQQDLTRIMEEIRTQYEAIVEKNRRETETWYKEKFDQLNTVVSSCTVEIQTSRSEVNELKRTLQSMEIEVQSQTSLKANFEATLVETESRYSLQLSQLQGVINSLEAELTQMRIEIERQGNEYRILLDIKVRLELEIAEYRRLLDGEDTGRSMSSMSSMSSKSSKSSMASTASMSNMSNMSNMSMKKVEFAKTAPVMTRQVRTVIEEIVDGKVVSHTEQVH